MKFRVLIFAIAVATCIVMQETNAAKVDCSNLQGKPVRYQCCPTPELITADLLDKCDEFMHPKYDFNSKHAGYDPSEPFKSAHHSNASRKRRTRAGLAMTYPCFLECIVNNTRINDDDHNINEPQLGEFLEAVLKDDNDLRPVMTQSFRVCATLVGQLRRIKESNAEEAELPKNSDPMIRERCPTLLTTLFTCTVLRTFIRCPSKVWYNTEECNESRETYCQCAKVL